MNEPQRIELAGHSAWVAAGWEPFLREALAPHFRHPEALPDARTIKENRVRTVARLEASPAPVFCKRFRIVKPLDRLLSRVKPSSARREWEALRHLETKGIAVPEPVILAEERTPLGCLVGSVLATREVPEAIELVLAIDSLREAGEDSQRLKLLQGLADLVFRVFQAGGDHPDFHLANFLVTTGGRLVVLDLHSLRLHKEALTAGKRRRRLGKLAHSFGLYHPVTAPHAERELQWFVAAYLQLDPELGPAEALIRDLTRRARRLENHRLAGRDRRCLVESTEFCVEQARGARVYRRRAIPQDALFAAVGAEPLEVVHAHPRSRSRAVIVKRPDDFPGKDDLLVKHYLFPSLRSRACAVLQPLPLRAWKAARACEVRHVAVPIHYGLIQWRHLWPARAAIVMELIADATTIPVLLQADNLPSPAARRRLACDLGRAIGHFHAAGLKHHDLAAHNILARPRSAGGAGGWDIWIIDLDEVRAAPMSRSEKLRALTRMSDLPETATRTDRLRFFRAYLGAGGREVLAPELRELGERGIAQLIGATRTRDTSE